MIVNKVYLLLFVYIRFYLYHRDKSFFNNNSEYTFIFVNSEVLRKVHPIFLFY